MIRSTARLMLVCGLFLAPLTAVLAAPVADPAVTQETVSGTVCVARHTRRIRPSSAWLRNLKLRLLGERGEPPSAAHRYQLDHVMPLVLGGAAKDTANYALQPMGDALEKDRLERHLGCLVCSGAVPLDEARAAFTGDWRSAAARYHRLHCHRRRH